MRQRAADEDAVHHAVEMHVVDEARPPGQQPGVFLAQWGSIGSRREGIAVDLGATVLSTASTMF